MKRLFLSALALCLVVSAAGLASAQITDINAIQAYDATGVPASPYNNQTVTVEGRVYVVAGTYNGGTQYIVDDNGYGIQYYSTTAPLPTYGDRVQVSGLVTTYSGEIEIGGTVVVVPIGPEAAPIPESLTVNQCLTDYENIGKFVSVSGTVTSKLSASTFFLKVGTDSITVYVDSDTGIDTTGLNNGDVITVYSPLVNYNTLPELKPRKQADLVNNPVIDDINCADWTPVSSDPITVTATITSDAGILSASLYYRDDAGDSTGAFIQVPMSNTTGDTWSGTIPATHPDRQVDFYISATDPNKTNKNPAAAPAAWKEVAVGFTPIYDVQYVDPSNPSQSSPYVGRVVNVTGVVTGGTGDIGSTSQFIIQQGDGPFTGLFNYQGTASNYLLIGDEVQVGGYISEYYGLTEMNPHNGTAVKLVSFDNALPTPSLVHTHILSDDGEFSGTPTGEAYESVFVHTYSSTVIDTVGADQYSEFMISDTGALADSLIVNPVFDMVYAPIPGDVLAVTGIMEYNYGEFQLTPLRDSDIWLGSTAVGDPTPRVNAKGGFASVSPNPFNPQTEIKFVLTRDALTQLNIYNLRGERVTTLVNEKLQDGEHTAVWDGKNLAGQRVASGTYFARLRIGADVLQVRKLMLVK